jgi:anti-sigma regulatory factor (Ser/Thr protein kinase)
MTTALQMATADLRAALSRLAQSVADHAALIAACRAAAAADARGDADPLTYVRELLRERGQLPAPGASPLLVLADARTAVRMAGWPAIRPGGHVAPDRELGPGPCWPLREPLPVRDLRAGPPPWRPGDPVSPWAAPCGCLRLPVTGSPGGYHEITCRPHAGGESRPPVIPGLARAMLYEAMLDGRPESAREARQWAGRILDGIPAAGDMVLALSELTANSAVHSASAGRPLSVWVRLVIAPGGWLRAEVRDDGPAPAGPGDTISAGNARPLCDSGLVESGRGLGIVAALAVSAGRADGIAWLVMPWQPAAVPAPARPRQRDRSEGDRMTRDARRQAAGGAA